MKPAARALTEEQIRVVLAARQHMKSRQLAAIMGVSLCTIQKIWRGDSYKEVAPDMPRFPSPTVPEQASLVCERCIHWLKGHCTLQFPESRNVSFARQCSVFVPND
jgi:hypothetical protein